MSVAEYKRPHRTFGRNLRAARIAADLDQSELALKLDTTVYAVRLYEQGRCLPSAEKLHMIVTLLGITTAHLFEDRSVNA